MVTKENVKEIVKELREKYPNSRIIFINSTEKENHSTNEKFRSYFSKFNGAYYGVRFDNYFNCPKYNNMIIVVNDYDVDRCIINGYKTLIIYKAIQTIELEETFNEEQPKLEQKETPKFEEISSDDDLTF